MLLALDPGTRSPGIAVFNEGVLCMAGRVKIPLSVADLSDGLRWLAVARRIVLTVNSPISGVIFERPQWYSKAKSKGDPNQLAGVAGVAACVVGILSGSRERLEVSSPTPAEWIGQVPKTCATCGANKKKCPDCKGSAWETPRGRRIRSRLSETELDLVPDQNDAIDACGLGLWALGRLTPRSVLSNGRDGR